VWFFSMSRTTLTAAFLKWSNRTEDHCEGVLATIGTGDTAFN
jgi:hypothetical protein